MSLNIEFSPTEEAWINEQSSKFGLLPAEVVKRLVDEHMPRARGESPHRDIEHPATNTTTDSTVALLQSWLREDATDDSNELRQAEEELVEFKRNMNSPRKENGERILFPEVE